jgi:integrase/recombinase XerC
MRETSTVADLSELATQWLAVKRVQHPDLQGNSHDARVDDLIRFTRALTATTGPRGAALTDELAGVDIGLLHEDAMYAAFASLIANGASEATVARTLSTVRNFTRWAARRGHLVTDPMLEVHIGAVRARPDDGDDDRDPSPVRAFSTDDVRALLHAAANPQPPHRSSWPVRDVAMLTLAARCGTRVSELCALTSRHVVRGGELAQLHLVDGTKRGRRRQVPVPGDTLTAIDAWLSERAKRLGDTMLGDPLFVRNDGRAVDRFFCDRLVRRCAAQGGVTVPNGAAMHALRHHFGVQLGILGVPGPVVQQLFGHTDPRTTSHYQRADPKFLIAPLRDAGWL